MSLFLTVIAVLTVLLVSLWRRYSFFSTRGIKGPTPLPLLGNILDNRHKPWMTTYKRREQKYGKIHGIFSGTTPILVVSDPVLLKKIMVQDFNYFTGRIDERFNHVIERQMIFAKQGEEWNTWRRAMTPAFSPQKLKAMMPFIDSAVDHLLLDVKKRTKTDPRIEVRSMLTNFTMEVIAMTGLGIQMDTNQQQEPMVTAIKQFFSQSSLNLVFGFFLPKSVKTAIGYTVFNKSGLEAAVACVRAVINERRKEGLAKKSRVDFTSALMSAKLEYNGIQRSPTDDEIIANILSLFLAGFEPQAILLSITIFFLAKYPEIQERLMKEVEECTASGADFESVKDMKYMEAVFQESLRLYPPSTYTERKVTKEYDMDGVKLPVGLDIFIPTYNIQHDESNFSDPEKFDPNRFLGQESESFAHLPFGHGPRACPGMRFTMLESKILLSRLMQEYEFVSTGQETIDISETVDEVLMTSDIVVQFRSRK